MFSSGALECSAKKVQKKSVFVVLFCNSFCPIVFFYYDGGRFLNYSFTKKNKANLKKKMTKKTFEKNLH